MTSKLIEIISRCNQLLDFMDRYNLTGLLSATEEQLREYVKEEYGLENTKEIAKALENGGDADGHI